MRRGYELHVLYGRRGSRTYRINFWEQPWSRWLVFRVYHWYDMRICKVPGFKLLENWVDYRHKDDDPLEYLPLAIQQDLRCYDLMVKRRTVLAEVDVDRETYIKLRGKYADD